MLVSPGFSHEVLFFYFFDLSNKGEAFHILLILYLWETDKKQPIQSQVQRAQPTPFFLLKVK